MYKIHAERSEIGWSELPLLYSKLISQYTLILMLVYV